MRISAIAHEAPTIDEVETDPDADAVAVDGGEDPARLEALAGRMNRIVIRFPTFKDGRGFSLAARLREHAGYEGELQAAGDILPDQARHLIRVGFDAAAPDELTPAWERAATRPVRVYQPTGVDARSAAAERAQAGRARKVASLNVLFKDASPEEVLRHALADKSLGRIAALSSFGVESAVLLHLIAEIDANAPVLFLETGRHFPQTLQYKDALIERLALTNVIDLAPTPAELARHDAGGDLWRRDPDKCCDIRKVRPLSEQLRGLDALITGRKRVHGAERAQLERFELVDGVIRVNPLAEWSYEEIEEHARLHELPQHPLREMGYLSVGCWTCTEPAKTRDDPRSGRWSGSEKTECGIHGKPPEPELETSLS